MQVSGLHRTGLDPSNIWSISHNSPALLLCHYHTVLYFVFYQLKKLTEDSPLPVTINWMHPSFPIQNKCILHNEYQQQISNITGLHNIQIRKTLISWTITSASAYTPFTFTNPNIFSLPHQSCASSWRKGVTVKDAYFYVDMF
jgi:hypothetical protein